jgi:hypothetical protein
MKLMFLWEIRLKLRAEGSKLYTEGSKLYTEGSKLRAEGDKLYSEDDKLYAEGSKLYTEGSKLYAEGSKLRAEADKLYAEADKLWAEGILGFYGNITLEWKNWNKEHNDFECHLSNGEIYGFDNLYTSDVVEITMKDVCEKFGKNVKIRKE